MNNVIGTDTLNTKFCKKCQSLKDKSFFYKKSSSSDGLYSYCKSCKKEEDKNDRKKHIEKRLAKSFEYRNKNRDKLREKNREWVNRTENKEKKKLYDKNRFLENKETLSKKSQEYYVKNKDEVRRKHKIYYQKNKTKIKETSKLFVINNKEKVRKTKNNWEKNKLKTDPVFKLKQTLRRRIVLALKTSHTNKNNSTVELTGCSIEYLKEYLESQFQEGMTWENHGVKGWHVGHIKPCEIFNLVEENEQRLCFNFKNLKPQWELENLSDGDSLPNGELARYILDDNKKEVRISLYGKDIEI